MIYVLQELGSATSSTSEGRSDLAHRVRLSGQVDHRALGFGHHLDAVGDSLRPDTTVS